MTYPGCRTKIVGSWVAQWIYLLQVLRKKRAYKDLYLLRQQMQQCGGYKKSPFVCNESVGGITSLQPRGASSSPRTIRIVHPCSFVDSSMHTSIE
jgi:hypothetical protein